MKMIRVFMVFFLMFTCTEAFAVCMPGYEMEELDDTELLAAMSHAQDHCGQAATDHGKSRLNDQYCTAAYMRAMMKMALNHGQLHRKQYFDNRIACHKRITTTAGWLTNKNNKPTQCYRAVFDRTEGNLLRPYNLFPVQESKCE